MAERLVGCYVAAGIAKTTHTRTSKIQMQHADLDCRRCWAWLGLTTGLARYPQNAMRSTAFAWADHTGCCCCPHAFHVLFQNMATCGIELFWCALQRVFCGEVETCMGRVRAMRAAKISSTPSCARFVFFVAYFFLFRYARWPAPTSRTRLSVLPETSDRPLGGPWLIIRVRCVSSPCRSPVNLV